MFTILVLSYVLFFCTLPSSLLRPLLKFLHPSNNQIFIPEVPLNVTAIPSSPFQVTNSHYQLIPVSCLSIPELVVSAQLPLHLIKQATLKHHWG